MKRSEIRENAIICVYQTLLLKNDIVESINNNIDDEKVKKDIFFLNITVNLFDHLQYLKNTIEPLLEDWAFERLGYVEQAILLVGVAELLSEDADKAVIINEAVEYSKKYAGYDSFKLINGVLDRV